MSKQNWQDPKFNSALEGERFIGAVKTRLVMGFCAISLIGAFFTYRTKKELPELTINVIRTDQFRYEMNAVCIQSYIKDYARKGSSEFKSYSDFMNKAGQSIMLYPHPDILKYLHENYLNGEKVILEMPLPGGFCPRLEYYRKDAWLWQKCNKDKQCLKDYFNNHKVWVKDANGDTVQVPLSQGKPLEYKSALQAIERYLK